MEIEYCEECGKDVIYYGQCRFCMAILCDDCKDEHIAQCEEDAGQFGKGA